MNTHDLPYWLLGATLLLWAMLSALLLAGAPVRDLAQAEAAPGFTIPEAHVGPVRVIPQASAALLSPCAGPDLALSAAEPAVAEL